MNNTSVKWVGDILSPSTGIMLVLLMLLAACVPVKDTPVPAEPPIQKAPVKDPAVLRAEREAARKQQVRWLLAKAQQALAEDNLMLPHSDNAYGWYQQVLVLDELNAEAHWGMQQITARYLELAAQAFQSGLIDKAETFLQRAEKIAATPQQTEALRAQYRQQAPDNEFYLEQQALTARNEAIQARLAELAQQVKAADLRLLIIARSDAEGRWIYQQMRDSVADYRLRGNIEIGQVPRIRLIAL